ncbi:DUF3857 domain-containing protein [Chitinivorax sp. B]|uniref:DUF3857 domain-containing transglutaminase family protein n=1 Tax=Chitinivorax sp. B TaxID=2502235 RepID=UPI0010F80A85|nr:DUF3857 domain-containing protein [Chitinivorax sp. B]
MVNTPTLFPHILLACSLVILPALSQASLKSVADAPLAVKTNMECTVATGKPDRCVWDTSYTILREAGRESVSTLSFDYQEESQFVLELAEVIQPDGRRKPVPPTNIDEKMAPNPAAGFSRSKQLSIAFPELQIGSTVHYRVRRIGRFEPLAPESRYVHQFWPNDERQDSLRIHYHADRPLYWRGQGLDGFTVKQSPDQREVTLTLDAPRYRALINEPGIILNPPSLEISTQTTLAPHFTALQAHYDTLLAQALPPKALQVAESLKPLPQRERVARLMQFIDQQYRYLGDWRASNRGLAPFNLDEIEAHGYGDCKDLASLLIAMLRYTGIEAEPAFLWRGTHAPDPLLPGTSTANHMVARAIVEGTVWWLDPTNPAFLPGETSADIRNRHVVILGLNGQPRQESTPANPYHSVVETRLKVQLRHDGSALKTGERIYSSDSLMWLAADDRRYGHHALSKTLCAMASQQQAGDCQLNRPAVDFLLPTQYPINIRFTDLGAAEPVSGYLIYDPLSQERDLWRNMKTYHIQQHQTDLVVPRPRQDTLTIDLIGATTRQLPKPCQVSSPWLDLETRVNRTTDGLRFHYRWHSKADIWFHPDIVSPPFQQMIDKASACVESTRMIVSLRK